MTEEVSHYGSQEKRTLSTKYDGNSREDGNKGVSDQRSPRSGILNPVAWVVLNSSLLVAEVQAALDSTITADLQPAIIDTFGEISKFPWINVTYSLGLSGSCLLW